MKSLRLMSLMLLMIVSMSFLISCSKDDDNPNNNSSEDITPEDATSLLIGRWYENYLSSYDTYEYLTLRKDGTGSWLTEYYDDDGRLDDRDRDTFSWTYDNNNKKIIFVFDYDKSSKSVYSVTKLTTDYLFIVSQSGYEYNFERND